MYGDAKAGRHPPCFGGRIFRFVGCCQVYSFLTKMGGRRLIQCFVVSFNQNPAKQLPMPRRAVPLERQPDSNDGFDFWKWKSKLSKKFDCYVSSENRVFIIRFMEVRPFRSILNRRDQNQEEFPDEVTPGSSWFLLVWCFVWLHSFLYPFVRDSAWCFCPRSLVWLSHPLRYPQHS